MMIVIVIGVLLACAVVLRIGNHQWPGDELMQGVEAMCWCFIVLFTVAWLWL